VAVHPDREPGHRPSSTCEGSENPRGLLFISDVQALRQAEAVTFQASNGVGVIDAWLTTVVGDPLRVYTAKQQQLFPVTAGHGRHRRIEVAADIAGYDSRRVWHDHWLPHTAAVWPLGGAQLEELWRSVAAFLRVGDVLRLRWLADTTISQLASVGLHRDDLCVEVRRGKRLWTFLLHVAVRPQQDRIVTTTIANH
jgi:hypothetical protein